MTPIRKQITAVAILVFMAGSVFAQGKRDLISANNALGQRDYDKAIELIDRAFEDEDMANNAKAHLYKGKIYATALIDTALTEKPANAVELAKSSLIKASELDEKQKFSKEISRQMMNVAIHSYNDGVAAIQSNDLASAYSAFSTTVEFNKLLFDKEEALLDTNAMYWKGVSAYSIGKKEEGISTINEILAMGYDKTFVYQKLINFAKLDESDNLIALIDEAKARYPNESYFKIEELNYYLNRGEGSKILDKMLAAVEAEPENLSLQIALASVYDQMGDFEAAQKVYEEVLDKDQDNFDALYSIGTMFFNKGKNINDEMNKLDYEEQDKYNELKVERDNLFKSARPFFQRAAEVNEDDQNTQLALRQISLIIGE